MVLDQRKKANTVSDICRSLMKKLSYELEIYQKLIEQEENKLQAIDQQDIHQLNKIVLVQESLLYERDMAEEQRISVAKDLTEELGVPEVSKFSEIVQLDINQQQMSGLSDILDKFREKILALNSIVETNRKLVHNNKDFFESLMERILKDPSEDIAYQVDETKTQKEKNRRKPVFLDANC